jgi:hypothetical protein
MCTHAASERERQRERQRERREERPVTNPIRISVRGIDSAQLPLVFGYQFHPDTNPRDRARERSPVTNSARLPSRGRRASGYRLPIRAIKGNGTPKDGQAGRRFRRLLCRASNPTHWRVVLYRFFGERCEFLHFGGRCIIGLSLLLVSISLRSAFTDSATFFGRIIQRSEFKLSLRGFINFCNSLIHVSSVFVGSELV